MGPRGEHSREEFLALVVDAAEAIASRDGLRGLGMRRVAAAVGYAPNSIYSAVGDLDRIVLHVNARTLGRLCDDLAVGLDPKGDARANTLRLADRYLDFVLGEARLWSLLFEHTMAPGAETPDWYAAALRRATELVGAVLQPFIPEPDERHRAVAALWAALHGLGSLASANKLAAISPEDPRVLARLLVGGFLNGLEPAEKAQSTM